MFNIGLDSSGKSGGLLKRLKNIEDKTDNHLRAIEGLKDNQLNKTIAKIKFSDEKLNILAEDVIKKTKKYENEDLEYTVAERDKYKVNLYKNLEGFLKKIMNGELSVKKAKEQQDELWNLIYKMKKRTSEKKRGKKFITKNKKIVLNTIKVGNELYNIRDNIIDAFEKQVIVEPNFEWIRDTEAFNEVLDMVEENIGLEAITDSKVVNLKSVSKFMDDILSGKTNNKYDAKKVYTKIMEDENLLRSYKNFSRNKNAQSTVTIISNLGYAVFERLLSSKDNADDIDIRDMPGIESEEDAAKRLITVQKISKTSNKEEPPKEQEAKGLKIMTLSQLIIRLPIVLGQKQAGNNSQKLNNEIRQIIYSLYRSNNLSKIIYNRLINSI